jgi:putative oxidoreductase
MNVKRIALYATLGLLSLIFLMAGGMKTIGTDEMIKNMNAIGYGSGWRVFIGITELLGVVGLWVPRCRGLALGLLWPYAVGGIAVHVSHGQPYAAAAVASVLIPVALWLDGRLDSLWRQPAV